jgi:hypothetical protein
MVVVLTGIGIVTGAFFFATRDVAGTVIFHNFLGVLGVVEALTEADALGTFARIQIPLIATATLTALVIAGGYWTMRTASNRYTNLARER